MSAPKKSKARIIPAGGVVNIPLDFKKALSKNRRAQEAFEKMPPSHKGEYVEAIVEAKKPETRMRRIDQAIKMLLGGRNR